MSFLETVPLHANVNLMDSSFDTVIDDETLAELDAEDPNSQDEFEKIVRSRKH